MTLSSLLPSASLLLLLAYAFLVPLLDPSAPDYPREFLSLDDLDNYPRNKWIAGEDSWDLGAMWTQGLLEVYEPVALMIKATIAGVAGGMSSVRPFLVATALAHATSAVLLVPTTLALSQALAAECTSECTACTVNVGHALGAAAFAVHPLRAEVLGWASCLPYALAGLGAQGSLWLYVRSRRAAAATTTTTTMTLTASGRLWTGATTGGPLAVVFAATALCKAAAIPLAGLFVLMDCYAASASSRHGSSPRRMPVILTRSLLWNLPVLLVGLAIGLVNGAMQRPTSAAVAAQDALAYGHVQLGLVDKILRAGGAIAWYPLRTLLGPSLAPRPGSRGTAATTGAGGGGDGGGGGSELHVFYMAPCLPKLDSAASLSNPYTTSCLTDDMWLVGCTLVVLVMTVVLGAKLFLDLPPPPKRLERDNDENENENKTENKKKGSASARSLVDVVHAENSFAVQTAFVWAAYLALVLPTTGLIVQHGAALMAADRYSYLPSMLLPLVGGCLWRRATATFLSAAAPQEASSSTDGATRARSTGSTALHVRRVLLPAMAALLAGSLWAPSCRELFSHWATTEKLWGHVVAVNPEHYYGHLALGKTFKARAIDGGHEVVPGRGPVRAGLVESASKHFLAAARIIPGLPEPRRDHATMLLATPSPDDLDKAIELLDESTRVAPRDTSSFVSLGVALLRKLERARSRTVPSPPPPASSSSSATASSPSGTNAEAPGGARPSAISAVKSLTKQARAALETALAIEPAHRGAAINLASLYRRSGRVEAAEQLLRECLDLPKATSPAEARGIAANLRPDVAPGKRELAAKAFFNLGNIRFQREDAAEAVAWFAAALAMAPTDGPLTSEAYLQRAQAQRQLLAKHRRLPAKRVATEEGRKKQSGRDAQLRRASEAVVADCRKALAADPSSTRAMYFLAGSLYESEASDQRQEALAIYSKAVAANPALLKTQAFPSLVRAFRQAAGDAPPR